MSDLKLCPFCGGEAYTHEIGFPYHYWDVWCEGECIEHMCEAPTKEAAIKAWNTRAERTAKPVDYPSRDYGFTYEAGDNEEYYGAFCGCSECGNFVPMRKYCMECGAKFERR